MAELLNPLTGCKAGHQMIARCAIPPKGWYCTRQKGHEGPCAATPRSGVAHDCSQSPVDHYCGDTSGEPDQGVSWAEGARIDSEKLGRIKDIHANTTTDDGGVTGFCCECDHAWPCPTYHIAAGWGLDSFHDCEEARWCSHTGVKF